MMLTLGLKRVSFGTVELCVLVLLQKLLRKWIRRIALLNLFRIERLGIHLVQWKILLKPERQVRLDIDSASQ